MNYSDVLIIGMGAAGMQLAFRLAEKKIKVTIICKGNFEESSTYWAQGGIAAPFGAEDSPQKHIQDTIKTGVGLCNLQAVDFIVNNSRAAVDEVLAMGFPASMRAKTKEPDLGKEGGHSQRRIIHAGDRTGKALADTLMSRILESPYINILTNSLAIDIIVYKHRKLQRCIGAYIYNVSKGKVYSHSAKFTALATGGASRVYLYSTNPQSATGDGIAMAKRAGCRVANMEFSQFHPTCLYHPQIKSFLISEALRGEGARLLMPNGKEFIKKIDKRGELAPRDILARAIDSQIKKYGLDFVCLDISHQSPAFIKKRFPNTYKECLKLGINITKEAIPVVPAAHYSCGGVITNLEGKTDINGLYALGETSYTGLHGANRLASNSLLECLVMARSVSLSIINSIKQTSYPPKPKEWDESRVSNSDEEVIISHNWDELRHLMWNYVGIVRTNKRLERALRRIIMLQQEVKEYYGNYHVNRDLLELRNLILCADLIVRSAIKRKESRGLHYNPDYPSIYSHKPPSPTIL